MPARQNKLTKFFQELKRRKVIAVIVVYATTAIILLELSGNLEESLNLPEWFDTVVTIILIIGFPIAVIFSWIFDVTSKGITKTEAKEDVPPAIIEDSVYDKSIIVLPFENISSDPEQEYFSDGLTEEIITDLSYIHELLVISRNSSMTFKGTKKKTKDIASDVNVRYVLEGSVRKSGDNLRIVAQLIDSADDSHIWAEKYNGSLHDIFDIQEKVSRSIAENLKIKLTQKEVNIIETASFRSSSAYELFHKAKYEFYYFDEERLKRALQYLDKAREVEGENQQLYFMTGMIYVNLFNVAADIRNDYLEKARHFMSKGFESNPESAFGYSLLGLITFFDGNIKDAVRSLQKSYLKNPSDPFVLVYLILGYFYTGQAKNAKKICLEIIEVDPFNPVNLILQAITRYMVNDIEGTLFFAKKAYQDYPEIPQVQLYYGYYLFHANEEEEACLAFEELTEKNKGTSFETLGKLFLWAIKAEEPDKPIAPDIMEKLKKDTEWLWLVADSYAVLNKREEALELLENIVERGFINFPLLSEYDRFLHGLHDEIRFKRLMKRVKKEWENFEA